MDYLRELIEYLDDNRVTDRLEHLERIIGRANSRITCSDVINWIEEQAKEACQTALQLERDSDRPVVLAQWLENDADLASRFALSGNALDFHPSINAEERERIRRFVADTSHPQADIT